MNTSFILEDNGKEIWRTEQLPLAYRRRVAMKTGGETQACHVVVLKNEIVFIFEKDGKIVKLPEFQENTEWYYPIV